MAASVDHEKWQVKMVRPGFAGIDHLANKLGLPDLGKFSWLNQPVRPADIGDNLRDAIFDRAYQVEDANYLKVVPNRFVIQVSRRNYARFYQPIQVQIIQQWTDQLIGDLLTANNRRGRKEFRFGGRLQLDVQPAEDLQENEARILCKIDQGTVAQNQQPVQERPFPRDIPSPRDAAGAAYLELVGTGQRWAIYPGVNTIGRNDVCQIYIDTPMVQEKRLISGQHAHIVMDRDGCVLYDGSPDGKPSANGTFVNLRKVPPSGYRIKNGDSILLASVDPIYPRSDTPGVATFYFWVGEKA